MYFYKKRVISIIPLYWAICILCPIYSFLFNHATLAENLALFPIELFGVQSIFSSLFGFAHNGGTWFISCILICYLVFPLLKTLVDDFSFLKKVFCICFSVFMLLFSPLVVHGFKIQNIYSNPFFRFFEFFIGVLLCSILKDNSDIGFVKILKSILGNWIMFFVECIILIIAVSFFVKMNFAVGDYMLYNWIALPMFMLMMVTLHRIHSEKLENSKILQYLSEISYAFFLAQFFTWKTISWVYTKYGIENNILKILLAFILCFCITVFLHEAIEKPLKKVSKKVFYKENN